MRGIGGTVSKTALKKTIPVLKKLNTVTQERDNLAHKLEDIDKTLLQLQQTVKTMAESQGQPVVVPTPTTVPFKSSQASSVCTCFPNTSLSLFYTIN